MYLKHLAVEGLPPGEVFADPARLAALPVGPQGASLVDALSLLRGALDADAMELEGAAGLRATEVAREGPLLDQVTGLHPPAVRALLAERDARQVRIKVSVALDPPMWRVLREQAARDPRLVHALGEGGRVDLRVGWLFNRAGDAASISLLGARVGQTELPVQPKERPAWLVTLAHELGRRIRVVHADLPDPTLGERLLAARLSTDPALRARAAAACRAFSGAPWGGLDLIRDGDHVELVVSEGLVPLRRWGPRAMLAARLAVVAWLDAPDILALTHPLSEDDPLLPWLSERVSADDATLEQVLSWGGWGGDP